MSWAQGLHETIVHLLWSTSRSPLNRICFANLVQSICIVPNVPGLRCCARVCRLTIISKHSHLVPASSSILGVREQNSLSSRLGIVV